MKNHIQTTTSGKFRVRLYRNGITYGGQHDEYEAAEKERDALLKQLKKKSKRVDLDPKWHKKQLATLPPFTKLTGIQRTKYGYSVKLSRAVGIVYGRHYSGEKALLEAVAARDALTLQYPLTR